MIGDVLGTTINQGVVPQYAVPVEGGPRTYKVVYYLATDITTTTSYRFNGRDMRLTDVHGDLIKEILA